MVAQAARVYEYAFFGPETEIAQLLEKPRGAWVVHVDHRNFFRDGVDMAVELAREYPGQEAIVVSSDTGRLVQLFSYRLSSREVATWKP